MLSNRTGACASVCRHECICFVCETGRIIDLHDAQLMVGASEWLAHPLGWIDKECIVLAGLQPGTFTIVQRNVVTNETLEHRLTVVE